MQSDRTEERCWTREESVAQLVAFDAASDEGESQRAFGQAHGVPRSTLQYWLARRAHLDASPALIAFFESPDGLAFLHRLVVATHFVICFLCGCGGRPILTLLDLAGLAPFVANSMGTRHAVTADMEAQIVAFAEAQRARLGTQMPSKRISVCEDETFHPEVCLVAVEPVSNFIILETYAEKRDAATWNATFQRAVADLPVTVVQSTSDEGKGLLGHVRGGLGAHHSPDVFHVQYELSRATSAPLAAQVRQAEQAAAKAAEATAKQRAAKEQHEQAEQGPGRPPDFETRIARAEADESKSQQALAEARTRQERARQAMRGLGQAYHPIDLRTGAPRRVDDVMTDLAAQFVALGEVAREARLPQRCFEGIAKAYRVLPGMRQTLTFFQAEAARRLDALGLAPDLRHVVEQYLTPAAYLELVADKAKPADARPPLRERAAALRTTAAPVLTGLAPEQRSALGQAARDCAEIFQRSSSCVEGRNGYLALRHHSLHSLPPRRLAALTSVHNYFLRRPDGSSAAGRFFGIEPADMFAWLLDHIPVPARPARRRSPRVACLASN